MDFRNIIRAELKRQGMSQAELSRRAHMAVSRTCDYLKAKRDVQAETLRKMLLALDIEVKPSDKTGKEGR